MQFWPRVRAKRTTARIHSWAAVAEAKPLGFAGYKVGMTHVMIQDDRPNSPTKGMSIRMPATVLECPPLKIAGIVGYRQSKERYGFESCGIVWADKPDPSLSRVFPLPKKTKISFDALSKHELVDVRLLVHTQPKLAGIGKKTPEVFELGIGGKTAQEKLSAAKELIGKEVRVQDVFAPGQQVDAHAVTKGKGFQGPVKRHGVKIRHHKSEKTKRGPGSLGPWHGPRTWTVAHAGQTGFFLRTEYNKLILNIAEPKAVNPDGGWVRYGLAHAPCILLKGSIAGSRKRLITLTKPIRVNPRISSTPMNITAISTTSRQR